MIVIKHSGCKYTHANETPEIVHLRNLMHLSVSPISLFTTSTATSVSWSGLSYHLSLTVGEVGFSENIFLTKDYSLTKESNIECTAALMPLEGIQKLLKQVWVGRCLEKYLQLC